MEERLGVLRARGFTFHCQNASTKVVIFAHEFSLRATLVTVLDWHEKRKSLFLGDLFKVKKEGGGCFDKSMPNCILVADVVFDQVLCCFWFKASVSIRAIKWPKTAPSYPIPIRLWVK